MGILIPKIKWSLSGSGNKFPSITIMYCAISDLLEPIATISQRW